MKLVLVGEEDSFRSKFIGLKSTVNLAFQIVFLKGPNEVFDAKVAVDDVELIDCDLPRAESECSDSKPFRCTNGVSIDFNVIISIYKISFILGLC